MTKHLTGFAFLILLLASCKKENANFTTASVNDYYPLQVGKYITYDLDSTIFTNFGQTLTVRHYQAQYKVDGQITDNLGREGYNIYRYLRQDSTQNWTIDNIFTVFSNSKSVEYIQDNLRFLKLMAPITEGFSWKGNSYLAYNPYRYYDFANPAFMEDWNYTYQDVNAPVTIGSKAFENTITVLEIADSTGDPKVSGTQYAEKTYSTEKYAEGVGLIFKDFIHWEYQGPQSISPGYTGFGEKLSIIDYN
jgi:hypothetical protein